jgi:hypothetical protein
MRIGIVFLCVVMVCAMREMSAMKDAAIPGWSLVVRGGGWQARTETQPERTGPKACLVLGFPWGRASKAGDFGGIERTVEVGRSCGRRTSGPASGGRIR